MGQWYPSKAYVKTGTGGIRMVNVAREINSIFNNGIVRSFLTKFRYPIILILFILLLPKIRTPLLLPGLLVSLFGEIIQLWSFASLDKNKTLSIKGPYELTRNPMYLGRFFLLLGGLLLTGNIWVILAFCVLYYLYMINRVTREEKRLRLLFGEAYVNYCREVNRFVPSLKQLNRKSLWFFKWRLLLQNHGHLNLIAVLSFYLACYLNAVNRYIQ